MITKTLNLYVFNVLENMLSDEFKEKLVNPLAKRSNLLYFGDIKF